MKGILIFIIASIFFWESYSYKSFSMDVRDFDELKSHNSNCKVRINQQVSISCADGYTAIVSPSNLFGYKGHLNADKVFNLTPTVDVQVGAAVTIT